MNHAVNRADWDLICVGSGISALTYAAALGARRPGMRILVLEQHTVPGGYSSVFHRPKLGVRFDCSLHKLTGMGEGGNLRALFRELGLEDATRLCFSPHWFEAAGALELPLPEDPGQALERLCGAFPEEREALVSFFEDVATHGRNSYMQFEIMLGRYEPDFKQLRFAHRHYKGQSVRDALRQRFRDPRLIELLGLPTIYVGAFPEQCSYLYYLHVVYASLHMRSAYMEGGSQRLSDLLVDQIRRRGGEVMLNVTVERVIVDEARSCAVGVSTDRGDFFGGQVLINAAPHHALTELFAPRAELATCVDRVSRQLPANSTSTLYLVLDRPPESLGLASSETMVLGDDAQAAFEARERARSEPGHAELAESAYWQQSSFEVTNYHLLDPQGGCVVIVNALDDIRHWPQRKTPEYRLKKKRFAETLLSRLQAARPALAQHVIYQEVSSPRTCLRYTNNTAGSGYGALVAPDAAPVHLNHRFPVGNVSFLSAWISGSGYEATMGYARMLVASMRPTP